MKFAIIGAGAVGMLTATLLLEAGASVQLYLRRREQASAISREGIVRDGRRFPVETVTDLNAIDKEAFVVIAVKQPALSEVLPAIAHSCPDQPLVFLQNGMLHLKQAGTMPNREIAVGSVEHGARKLRDNEISHTGKGTIKFALLKGTEETFRPLLRMEGVKAEWHNDADRLLFRKTLLNCMINPLTALMGIPNGELLTNVYAYALLRDLYMELYAAFPEIGEMLPFEQVTALCATTAQNESSMLADKRAGRPMELETILHYTLERSPADLPLLRAFYHLLKSTEG